MPRKFLALPSLDQLNELFELAEHSQSGLKWKANGKDAGIKKGVGYWYVSIKGQYYLCHRIIFFMRTGINPGENFVDHKNRNRGVNDELRLAQNHQNTANTGKRTDRKYTSKYKGVSWQKHAKRWIAQIETFEKARYLGSFLTEEDAAKAYNIAAKETWGEFAYLNEID
jgi:hypothetical protein